MEHEQIFWKDSFITKAPTAQPKNNVDIIVCLQIEGSNGTKPHCIFPQLGFIDNDIKKFLGFSSPCKYGELVGSILNFFLHQWIPHPTILGHPIQFCCAPWYTFIQWCCEEIFLTPTLTFGIKFYHLPLLWPRDDLLFSIPLSICGLLKHIPISGPVASIWGPKVPNSTKSGNSLLK